MADELGKTSVCLFVCLFVCLISKLSSRDSYLFVVHEFPYQSMLGRLFDEKNHDG